MKRFQIKNEITQIKLDRTFKKLARDIYKVQSWRYPLDKLESIKKYDYEENAEYYDGCFHDHLYFSGIADDNFRRYFADKTGFDTYYPTDWAIENASEYTKFDDFLADFYLRVLEAERYRILSFNECDNEVRCFGEDGCSCVYYDAATIGL